MGLTHVQDRVVVKVDMEKKNSHTFDDGTKIHLARKYDNFDRKYTQPVNAVVVSGENIPADAEVLIHHNSTDATNLITNHDQLSGDDIASDIKYFSIPVSECFAWYDGKEWQPFPGFDFALRVFTPYNGPLHGIEPTQIKDTLYITTGEFKGLVCLTLKACDYEIVYQDKDGRESRLIRFRSSEDEKTKREQEIVAIAHDLTAKVQKEQLYVGLNKSDCKPLNQYLDESKRTSRVTGNIVA